MRATTRCTTRVCDRCGPDPAATTDQSGRTTMGSAGTSRPQGTKAQPAYQSPQQSIERSRRRARSHAATAETESALTSQSTTSARGKTLVWCLATYSPTSSEACPPNRYWYGRVRCDCRPLLLDDSPAQARIGPGGRRRPLFPATKWTRLPPMRYALPVERYSLARIRSLLASTTQDDPSHARR